MGDDPLAGRWTQASVTTLQSLASWIIRGGSEDGAVASPYSGGYSDFFATYEAVWGLAMQPFPLIPVQVIEPPSTTTSTASVGVAVVAPAFTG